MKIDLFLPKLADKEIKTDVDVIWLFARYVTCETNQIIDLTEVYDDRNNVWICDKKYAFRGVGLDENDDPIINVMDKKHDQHIITPDLLSEKDKKRVLDEIYVIANMIESGVYILCSNVYEHEENKEINVIDCIRYSLPQFDPNKPMMDWDLIFIINGFFAGWTSYLKDLKIDYKGKEYTVYCCGMNDMNLPSLLMYPSNKIENKEMVCIFELDNNMRKRIVDKMKEGEEEGMKKSLERLHVDY